MPRSQSWIFLLTTLAVLPVAAQDPQTDHRFAQVNGIRMHFAEQGRGPLVVLVHGFPETWYSWRHQIPALAAAGYHVVAPDLRGFGQTELPPEISSYTIMHLVGDIVGLVETSGGKQAIIVGHDWGATVAWNAALLRPDMFPAVVGMSTPYRPRVGTKPPLRLLRDAGLFTHYWLYYQDASVADPELDRDPRATLRRRMYTNSGDAPRNRPSTSILQPGKGMLDNTLDPEHLPAWLTESDLDNMAADFRRTGFRGGLNLYRNIDRNWELLAPERRRDSPTALFIRHRRPIVGTPRQQETSRSYGENSAEPEAINHDRGSRPLHPAGAPPGSQRRAARLSAFPLQTVMVRPPARVHT